MLPNLTPTARGRLYWAGWIGGLLAAVITAIVGALDVAPQWLLIALAIVLAVQGQISALAGRHVDPGGE